MDKDERVLAALLELSVTLGVALTAARRVEFVKKLDDLPVHAVEWACDEAGKRWEYQSMPQPAYLRKLAAICPPLPKLAQPYNSRQVAECTTTQVAEAREWLKKLAAGLVDEVALPPKSVVDLAERREALRQQAESLGVEV